MADEQKTEQNNERKKRIKAVDCANCNKHILHRLWYYRDGQYYCNRSCWLTAKKKKQEEAASAK